MDESSHAAFKKIWNQNPSLGDLNLEGLSQEEKERILEVVRKEQVATYLLASSSLLGWQQLAQAAT